MRSSANVPAIALYYPYPFVQNDTWLKKAALYWDKIFRIVPVNFHSAVINEFRVADHTPTAKVFIEEFDFIRDYVVPDRELRYMSKTSFYAAASGLLDLYRANPEHFRREMARTKRPYFSWGEMERSKANCFAWDFGQLGFLKDATGREVRPQRANPDEKLYFEDYPGRVYMSILAKYIASELGIPVITDDPEHDIILKQEALCFTERFREHDMVFAAAASSTPDLELGLFDIALQAVQLKNIEDIPPSDIVKIRREFDEERRAFVSDVRSLVTAFYDCFRWARQAIDEARIQSLLDDYAGQLNRRLSVLQNHLRKARLETLLEVTSVSFTLPLTEAVAALLPVNEPLLLTGAATLGVSGVLFRSAKRRDTIFSSEMSTAYLHHLGLSTASGFLHQVAEAIRSFLNA